MHLSCNFSKIKYWVILFSLPSDYAGGSGPPTYHESQQQRHATVERAPSSPLSNPLTSNPNGGRSPPRPQSSSRGVGSPSSSRVGGGARGNSGGGARARGHHSDTSADQSAAGEFAV